MSTAKSKSDLGWGFLTVVETGRYKEYSSTEANKVNLETLRRLVELQESFFVQVENAQAEVQDGPGNLMKWRAR